ncbi:hypothetical protein BD410DRAFT_196027 [Rickenella mellea]|uniref:RRM domain-containing protein n=1 Tax=Rickenella mellea TaxID=50990 RepID=A0A4Y7Q779_9AGAM|nr:hypothetical protein BD410DRAFT_196027 [Rickenella mellea]
MAMYVSNTNQSTVINMLTFMQRRSKRGRSRSRSRSRSRRRSNSPHRRSRRSRSRSRSRSARSRTRSRSRDRKGASEPFSRSLGGPMNAEHEEAMEMAKNSKRENRVYVGNLSYDVRYRDLMEFMRGGGWGNTRLVFGFLRDGGKPQLHGRGGDKLLDESACLLGRLQSIFV